MTQNPTAKRDLRALCLLYFLAFTTAYIWTIFPRTLESLGWSGAAIGTLYSARKLIDTPSLWGWGVLADRWNRRAILRLQLLVGFLSTGAIALFIDIEALMVPAVLCYSATAACIFPIADSLTIARVGPAHYGFVRSWGSAGYALMALGAAGIGLWTGNYEEFSGLAAPLLVITMCAAALSSLALPDADTQPREKPSFEELLRCFKNPMILALLLIGALHWSCQAPLNLFLVALCEHKELPVWTPGMAIFIGVTCEFLLLANSERFLRRMRPSWWLLTSIVSGALRWWLMAWLDDTALMMLVQVLHGLTFGAFFMASIALLTRHVPESLRSSGQALFYLSVFGLGSILGNAMTGLAFDHYDVVMAYQMAAGMEIFLLIPGGLFAWHVITR